MSSARTVLTVAAAVEMLRPYMGDAVDLFLEASDGWNWPEGRWDKSNRAKPGSDPLSLVYSLVPVEEDFETHEGWLDWKERADKSGILLAYSWPESWVDPEEWRLRDV